MSDRCETVRIVAPTDQGYAVINKEDFDESQHVLFVEPQLNLASPEEEAQQREEHEAAVDQVIERTRKGGKRAKTE